MDIPTKLEFAVQLTCQSCVDAIYNVLNGQKGVQSVQVKLDTGQVIVESTLPSEEVKAKIESTGKLAVLLGMGGSGGHWGAAVAAMNVGSEVAHGVVRMVQVTKDRCVVEGTVDGLPPGCHALSIHETGDISRGCESCGDVLGDGITNKARGMLTELKVGSNGSASFRLDSSDVKVWDLIGRSLVVHQGAQPSTNNRLVCGIIARSSGLFQNSKRLCACDGVTIWEERNKPLAGAGRSNISSETHLHGDS